jgi:hypothetical protein
MKDLDALGQTSGFPAPETLIMSLPLELTSLFYIAREYRYHSVFAWLQRQQRANKCWAASAESTGDGSAKRDTLKAACASK